MNCKMQNVNFKFTIFNLQFVIMDRIGLIAGNGRFPILFAQVARKNNVSIVAVAFEDETSPEIEQYVEKLYWVSIGQIGKLIKIFKNEQITKAVMAGGITKAKMYSPLRNLRFKADLRTINLWYKTLRKGKKDKTLLGAFADELAKDGIEVQDSTLYVPHLLAQKGCLTKRQPSEKEMADVQFGWDIAKEISRLEIGQCVVVKEHVVVAVEAIEGTDETIKRGGLIGRGNVVAVKVSRPHQDFRFDIPTIGPKTIDTLKEAGVTTLAIEAGKTLVLDKEEMIAGADRENIAIVAL